jgi:hypothetical protein
MNTKVLRLFATVFIATLIIGTISAAVRAAEPAPDSIYVVPDTVTFDTGSAGVGDKFNVTVCINTDELSYAWQVKLLFNPAHIQAVRLAYTMGALGSAWFYPLDRTGVPAVIDNVTGFVLTGETLNGAINRTLGNGTLFWVEFQIMAAPPFGGSLTSLIDPTDDIDLEYTYILDDASNTIGPQRFGFCTYTFNYLLPSTNPHFEVVPSSRVFDEFTNWVGTPFTEDLMLKNVNDGWLLSNVSVSLDYNNTLTSYDSAVFDPVWNTTSVTELPVGTLNFVVGTTATPSGDVKIATITYTILNQGSSPPRPFWPNVGSYDESKLHIHASTVTGNSGALPIPTEPAVDGDVIVKCFQLLVPPHLEVSDVTVPPSPGPTLFNVTVSLVGVHFSLNVIGYQFRLQYDNTLLLPTAVYEGPFLPEAAALQPGNTEGTWFISYIEDPDGIWGPHVLIGNMIYPNDTGMWNPPMLNGSGVVAIITFQTLMPYYSATPIVTPLTIVDDLMIGLDNLVDQNIEDKPLLPPDNGLVTIMSYARGRFIDVYGYAYNSGKGPVDSQQILQFPPPYGGQGQDAPMDMVEPQSQVVFHANVTYNYWPVQHKLVGFQVINNTGGTIANLFAFTDTNGVATVTFRMPWPCDDPESLFGVWTIISTVQLADVVINDTLAFHYDYIVHIWKVTTVPIDKYYYEHGEYVCVFVEWGSHAQQEYDILVKVYIADELGVIIGSFAHSTHVGGTVFCQYKNDNFTDCIYIPKWAYAGIATIHASVFDNEPMLGGVPLGPEYTPPPEIAILPS